MITTIIYQIFKLCNEIVTILILFSNTYKVVLVICFRDAVYWYCVIDAYNFYYKSINRLKFNTKYKLIDVNF